jgi:hypothetical protein
VPGARAILALSQTAADERIRPLDIERSSLSFSVKRIGEIK